MDELAEYETHPFCFALATVVRLASLKPPGEMMEHQTCVELTWDLIENVFLILTVVVEWVPKKKKERTAK